ncbi:hypothetical protein JCGZ_13420 [Jatropha curcas]|uniref:BHLH domain-containing protein n=1 Tax=Jatropha curcas TaxID=180498 RepID=A0A067KLM1_JATCU|nr:putative transcription factor bHLH086 [Jatropha curcas]KDP33155.1 hypothetical protein JCGZ_13420 [Jatropha curcas]
MALAKDRTWAYKFQVEEGETNSFDHIINSTNNFAMSHSSSSLGSPSSANSNDFLFHSNNSGISNQTEEAHSLINFAGGFDNFIHANGSLLSFQHNNNNFNYSYKCNSVDPRLSEDINCFQTATNSNPMTNFGKENIGDWLYCEKTMGTDDDSIIQESGEVQEVNFHKRPNLGENMQALKKQCNSATKKSKITKPSPSKDPQSIAAKNRRERISERLKILQELVPNGSKVDLVTMLEKAISYVKFLQLQVKVLATDEFWPVQGGKAPDISQVKEAIDAILSSQKDRNSSSSSK